MKQIILSDHAFNNTSHECMVFLTQKYHIMKKIIFSFVLLTCCAIKSEAQFQATGASGGNVTGSPIGTNSIIVGNGASSGSDNVFIGNNAGTLTTTGNANTFVGQGTGYPNTTGLANTFLGAWTASSNTTGTANTFVGQYCGVNNTTGYGNVLLGQGSGNANTTGSYSVFIGKDAGAASATGLGNIALGPFADFTSGGLTNAIAIGAYAQATTSNTMILGGAAGGITPLNVGIGTSTPGAHIHTVNALPESIIFSTTDVSGSSASALNMNTPGNYVRLVMNNNTHTGTFLSALTTPTAPAIPMASMATLLTDGSSPIAIGVDGAERTANVHFINGVAGTNGVYNRTECMRINKANGFVGIHTRSATSGGGTGDPQALFHVNLTNPAYSSLSLLTQGIRFEGLPHALYDSVIVIDHVGNLAKAPYSGAGTGPAWLLAGNATTGVEWIGTDNTSYDDFRIKTHGILRARITADGNFDLGGNTPTSATTTSAAMGTNNSIDHSISSAAIGINNLIDSSTNVLAAGDSNEIRKSASVAALGGGNYIISSNESVAAGENDSMINGHGCFLGGGHNFSDGMYNLLLGNRCRAEVVPTPMPIPPPLSFSSIMIIGEQIHSNLNRSLSIGFTGNRTIVTTKTGVAIQLAPTALATYNPTVNFEVEASPTPVPPLPAPGIIRSNIRFHHLPLAPKEYPAVLVDPATGELFQSTLTYAKSGTTSSPDLDSLQKENQELKSRLSQLESKISSYDEQFGSLQKSIIQICEGGCAGVNTQDNDALYQSIPNPTDNNAIINYYLSRNYTDANISIYSLDGRAMHTYVLNPEKGNGSINVIVGDLQPGMYLYKLVVDGKQVGSKKLQKQ